MLNIIFQKTEKTIEKSSKNEKKMFFSAYVISTYLNI